MKINELLEAPIGDFDLVNNFNRDGSFDPEDRKALQNFKYVTKIKKRFENIPYDFNFYFLNLPVKLATDTEFTADFDNLVPKLAGVYKTAGDVENKLIDNIPGYKDTVDHIKATDYSCLFLSNANPKNANKIPLTPWILVHRYVHGVDDSSTLLSWVKYKALLESVKSIHLLLTMKSSRLGINTDAEIELAVQYIMQGSVQLRNSENTDPSQHFSDVRIQKLTQDVNAALALVMADLKDKLVVTI